MDLRLCSANLNPHWHLHSHAAVAHLVVEAEHSTCYMRVVTLCPVNNFWLKWPLMLT